MFVCPAMRPVAGVSVVEAMAAGRPVIASRAGVQKELIVQGETVRLVPVADAAAIATTSVRLLARPDERLALVAAARAFVAAEHCGQVAAEASADVYIGMVRTWLERAK